MTDSTLLKNIDLNTARMFDPDDLPDLKQLNDVALENKDPVDDLTKSFIDLGIEDAEISTFIDLGEGIEQALQDQKEKERAQVKTATPTVDQATVDTPITASDHATEISLQSQVASFVEINPKESGFFDLIPGFKQTLRDKPATAQRNLEESWYEVSGSDIPEVAPSDRVTYKNGQVIIETARPDDVASWVMVPGKTFKEKLWDVATFSNVRYIEKVVKAGAVTAAMVSTALYAPTAVALTGMALSVMALTEYATTNKLEYTQAALGATALAASVLSIPRIFTSGLVSGVVGAYACSTIANNPTKNRIVAATELLSGTQLGILNNPIAYLSVLLGFSAAGYAASPIVADYFANDEKTSFITGCKNKLFNYTAQTSISCAISRAEGFAVSYLRGVGQNVVDAVKMITVDIPSACFSKAQNTWANKIQTERNTLAIDSPAL